MNGISVLLVSGEHGAARSWDGAVRDAGAEVRLVLDGSGALQHLDLLKPDVILIDLDLPGALSGFDTCRSVRSHSDAVVVLVATEAEAFDEVVALAVGADHFFSADEPGKVVVARLQSLVRRARGLVRVPAGVGGDRGGPICPGGRDCPPGRSQGRLAGRIASRPPAFASAVSSPVAHNGHPGAWAGGPSGADGSTGAADRIVAGDLEIDLEAREVLVNGAPVVLTRIEFDLLATLAEQPRRVFTREQLMERAWGDAFDGSHVLDTHLSRLRCKVTSAGGERVGHAVRGVGYRLRG